MARRCVPNKKPAWWPEAPRSGPTLAHDPNGLENRLSRAAPPKRVQELRGASSTTCGRVPLPQNQRSLLSPARRGPVALRRRPRLLSDGPGCVPRLLPHRLRVAPGYGPGRPGHRLARDRRLAPGYVLSRRGPRGLRAERGALRASSLTVCLTLARPATPIPRSREKRRGRVRDLDSVSLAAGRKRKETAKAGARSRLRTPPSGALSPPIPSPPRLCA